MNRARIVGAVFGGSAALMLLSGTSAVAQMQSFPNGIDCSKLPQFQQNDCRVQQQNSITTPWAPPQGPTVPGNNGTGTEQNGRIMPYDGSGQTNGSSYGAGGGNGGASPPGQSGN